jgi:hypothetical protein
MRIVVVGAGVYGATIAVALARVGHQVQLHDRHRDLLYGATRANQMRLHLGYHYPRSFPTAKQAMADAERFVARFPNTINRRNQQLYAIAQGSRISPDEYLAFCDRLDGGHRVLQRPPSFLRNTALCVQVPEAIIDVHALREQLRRELRTAGARFVPSTTGTWAAADLAVYATYGVGFPEPLRFEVTEVALVDLAGWYSFRSVVVLDGTFCSLDPVVQPGTGGRHLLYHVDHSVHAANIGRTPRVPEQLRGLVDAGLVRTSHSAYPRMLAAASCFLEHMEDAIYQGSLLTVRAVLPDVDDTDERPTIIRHDQAGNIHVLAGKVDGAVAAAEQVGEMVG